MSGRRFYLASNNAHKAAEFAALAAASGLPIEIVSAQAAGGMPAVTEDAGTFTGNARKKARALRAKVPAEAGVIADDSGLCVDALDGAPGVESAYYAGPEGDAAANLAKLVRAMQDVTEDRRGAHFVCVLVVLTADGTEEVFEGVCGGSLVREPRGGAGFGYDPLFVPDGHAQTYAELGDDVKNRVSHRARAWARFAEWVRRTR
ncbi:MAG TPA: RdgB/HAM1 family non-canonical purine NTP pyrophosphatase [Opitutus sp.]|nr:RdgB/HAM1 family non-canonical purine NTP pyrophosphatase [Opitutus sp.]